MHTVIAIDGPAASGKSSVARDVAARIGFSYVNSGNYYRAVTWHTLALGREPDAFAVTTEFVHNHAAVRIDGLDHSAHFRDPPVNSRVSLVSANPNVRAILSAHLRSLANDRDIVMEGRDIGTVVFPETPHKFYLDAPAHIREKRRSTQGEADAILTRDHIDSSRASAPLTVAPDAVVIHTTTLTIPEVVEAILARLPAAIATQ